MPEGQSDILATAGAGVARRAIVVLGMHRSGTSAITYALSLLGAALPLEVLGAGRGNAVGHWEPTRLLHLHDKLLAAAGSRWDDWRALDLSVVPGDALSALRGEIKATFNEEYADHQLVVLKEPRVCRFAGFYVDLLAEMGVRPHFVIPIRNPLAVMASLQARDGQSAGFAGLLWLRHTLDAERSTRGFPRAIVSYERVLANWREAFGMVAARIGLPLTARFDAAASDIGAFISAEHQHHAPSRLELEARDDIAAWVKRTYAAMRTLEKDPDSDEARAALDEVTTAFDAAAPVFGAAFYDELAQRELVFEARRRDDAAAHQNDLERAEGDAVIRVEEAVAREKAASDHALNSHASVIKHFGERIGDQATEVAGLRFQVGQLGERVGEQAVDLADLRYRLAESEAELGAARDNLSGEKAKAQRLADVLAQTQAAHLTLTEQTRALHDVAIEQMSAERDAALERARRTAWLGGVDESVPSLRPSELDLTIVVPCYDQGQFVPDELALLEQEQGITFEVVVIDDGSTEARTARALEEAAHNPHVRVVRQENAGLSAARNAGLLEARGEFVIFLDADDVLLPGVAQRVQQARDGAADITIFDYVISNEFITYFERPQPYTISADMLTSEGFKYRWERGLTVPIHSAIFRRHKIKRLFNPALRAKEDWVFWVSNFSEGVTATYVPTLQAIYRQSSVNMTKNVGRMMESWIFAARHLAESMGEEGARFLEASMQHVRSYYVPVLQWQAKYLAQPRSRVEYAAHKIWTQLSDGASTSILPRRAAGAVIRRVQRRLSATKTAIGAALRSAKHAPWRTARRANFAIRRSEPKAAVSFSFIVPVYNHAQHLSRCFSSLTDQRYRAAEIIAIDDCSPDPKVREIMGIYAEHNPYLFNAVYNERNLGISATLNKATDMARGEWLVLVDCDDYLELDALASVARAINGRDEISYVFSDRRRIDEVARRTHLEAFGGRPDLLAKPFPYALRMSMVASHLKAIRRDLHHQVGGYDEAVDGVQDWDFAIRALNSGAQFSYVPKPVYNYRWHTASVSLSAAVSQWRLANRVRAKTMFGARDVALTPELERAMATHACAADMGGGALMPIAKDAVPAGARAVTLQIHGYDDLHWVERIRCEGFAGELTALVRAPYNPELAGYFRQMSGFFDLIVVTDPMWSVALAPVAADAKKLIYKQAVL